MTRSKADWRRALLSARASIPERARRTASDAIASRVRQLQCVRDARTIFGYVALGAEVDPNAILVAAHASGVSVLIPSPTSAANDPSWVAHPSLDDCVVVPPAPVPVVPPTVAIVPGVGFDESGTRLGRGAGFYDRALARLRSSAPVVVVGIAFDAQIVTSLPRDRWDESMDIVVSESRLLVTSNEEIDAMSKEPGT